MKVCEVLDQEADDNVLKTDIKHNKGKAVTAIVGGAKRKSNGVAQPNNNIDPDTEMVKETIDVLTEDIDWYITRAKFRTGSKLPNNVIYAAVTQKFKDNMNRVTVQGIVDIIHRIEANK